MANKWELAFEMTVAPQGEGTLVTRSGRLTKVPLLLTPMKLLIAMAGPMGDKKLLNNMKADLEGSSG